MSGFAHVTRIGALSCMVGESPLWDARAGAWFWVDIPAKTLWRLDGSSGALASWQGDEMLACVALREQGGFIAGMESGIFTLQPGADGMLAATRLAAPPELQAGMRFNDGRCDRQGRFWSGTMWLDMAAAKAVGRLYRVEADGIISAPLVSELIVQNGLAWSPDGRTMYLSDSHPTSRLVWACDYDTASGVPSRRRVFADLHQYVGRPDGAAIDVDGCYWTCANDAGCLLRFTPEGKLDRRIDLPMKKPSMCSFGGADMATLLVTSIAAGKAEGDLWAGAVVTVRPGVQGVPEARFSG